MNKQKFTQIVKDYQYISADDRKKLQVLAAENPYSQILHTLVAKANSDAKTNNAKATLGFAAMYATDRGVLKNIISAQPAPDTPKKQEAVKRTQSQPPVQKSKEARTNETENQSNLTALDEKAGNETESIKEGDFWLSQTVMDDLKDLSESKKKYYDWLEIYENEASEDKQKTSNTSHKKSAATKKTASKSKTESKGEVKSKISTKSSSKINTKSSSKKSSASGTEEKKKVSKPAKESSVTKETSPLKSAKKTKTKSKKLNSKKSTSKKNSDAQPDQIELIEKFISKEPSITAKASRKSVKNQEDLSQPSTEFKEDLVSENLAKIMISQGKAEKAVEIYKKLIWKFPQKKSYFATQIEKLKNNKE